MHINDFAPYSKGRTARILEIYEAAYWYRRMPAGERTRGQIYIFKDKYNMDNTEVLFFIDIITSFKFKQIRRYLLDNGSTVVRQGKKTRPRKNEENT